MFVARSILVGSYDKVVSRECLPGKEGKEQINIMPKCITRQADTRGPFQVCSNLQHNLGSPGDLQRGLSTLEVHVDTWAPYLGYLPCIRGQTTLL